MDVPELSSKAEIEAEIAGLQILIDAYNRRSEPSARSAGASLRQTLRERREELRMMRGDAGDELAGEAPPDNVVHLDDWRVRHLTARTG